MAENVISPKTGELDDFDYWRLCEELTILDAALLVVGQSPNRHFGIESRVSERRPTGYDAAKTAISNALRAKKIDGHIIPEEVDDHGTPFILEGTVSLSSRVDVESLKAWLRTRGLRTGFFFAEQAEAPDYLDPSSARYAPKMAAAVSAWMAVTDPGGRSPKQALMKWIREHAAEFGLTDDDGKPNESAIEDIAKVANWQMTGGAPKTPSGQEPSSE